MENTMFITRMTFYDFEIDIYYQSIEGGTNGFMYTMNREDKPVSYSLPVYKTALDSGIAALNELKVIHNEKK